MFLVLCCNWQVSRPLRQCHNGGGGVIYVKRANAKNNVISYHNFKWGFTPDSNSKSGNTKIGKNIDINNNNNNNNTPFISASRI